MALQRQLCCPIRKTVACSVACLYRLAQWQAHGFGRALNKVSSPAGLLEAATHLERIRHGLPRSRNIWERPQPRPMKISTCFPSRKNQSRSRATTPQRLCPLSQQRRGEWPQCPALRAGRSRDHRHQRCLPLARGTWRAPDRPATWRSCQRPVPFSTRCVRTWKVEATPNA